MIFELTILGNSSATPTLQRHPTGQVLNYNEKLFLIDCGEGSQTQMLRYRIKYHRINNIFISHLHGDHFFGLMGFLSTLHLQGRTNPLTIFAPQPLEHIIRYQLEVSETSLRYPLSFCYLNHEYSTRIYEDTDLTIETIILKHRIPCTGFLFREKPRARKLIKARIQEDEVPVSAYSDLKEGHDHTAEDGRVFRCADYL
jgi:ribonuclease Z